MSLFIELFEHAVHEDAEFWSVALTIYCGIVSVITFIVYGIDKAKAKANGEGSHKRRVPERILLLLAFLGGAPGAAAGMLTFHHKTKKPKFGILVPIALILWVGLITALWLSEMFEYLPSQK